MSPTPGIVQHLRRRGGAPGAPPLKAGQPFINEAEGVAYVGTGDDGQGNATDATKFTGQGFIDARVQAAVVDSIAALRALPFAVLSGIYSTFAVDVKSYTAGGGGSGGGKFVWNASSTAADDGGTIINPTGNTGSGRWLRLLQFGFVTPQMFNAKGDGNTDDSAALNAALSTALDVFVPPAAYRLTNPVVFRQNGQKLYGSGRLRTRFYIDTGSTTANSPQGVFVFSTGEPGPHVADIGIFFTQPDTATYSALNTYIPAFFASGTPRFIIERCGIYAGTVGAYARGLSGNNSGGATIRDLQGSCFQNTLDIDDATDSVRIRDVHCYPFFLTANQASAFLANVTHFNLGRIDDGQISGCLFFGGLGIYFDASATTGTPGFYRLTDCDFDSYSGINVSQGSVHLAACAFTLAITSGISIQVTGGIVAGSAIKFLASVSGRTVVISGGHLTLAASTFENGVVDLTNITQAAGSSTLILSDLAFFKDSTTKYSSVVVALQGGSTKMIECLISDLTTGTGTFVSVGNDNGRNKIAFNTSVGWPAYTPSNPLGVYVYN